MTFYVFLSCYTRFLEHWFIVFCLLVHTVVCQEIVYNRIQQLLPSYLATSDTSHDELRRLQAVRCLYFASNVDQVKRSHVTATCHCRVVLGGISDCAPR